MKKKNLVFIGLLIVLIAFSVVIMNAFYHEESETYSVNEGQLNLNEWDNSNIRLVGDWSFYQSELYNKDMTYKRGQHVYVPSEWQNMVSNNNSPYGYGTYIAKVTGLDADTRYGFRLLDQVTAYNLYINDELVASNGIVADNNIDYIPEWIPQSGYFIPDEEGSAVFAIEIANFEYNRGGFWNSIEIGEYNQIINAITKSVIVEIFLFSSIFVVGVFVLWLHFNHKRSSESLYLALFCFSISFRILLTGQRNLNYFGINLNWESLVRLEYLFAYLILPFFGLFFIHVYKSKFNKVVKPVLLAISVVYSFVVLLTEPKVFTQFLSVYKYIGLLLCLYFVIIFSKALFKGDKDANYTLVALTAAIIAMIKDIYFGSEFTFIPIAAFIMIICFAMLTIRKFVDLDQRNINLENEVITDKTTGLYTKQYLINFIDNYIKNDGAGVYDYLLFLDLDNFKEVNDKYGHIIGDVVLKEVASRLRGLLRSSDVIARYGGDEFLIFIACENEMHVEKIASRIIEEISEPIEFRDWKYSIGVSIGICKYHKELNVNKWIYNSDLAMYNSKKDGKNKYTIYDHLIETAI